MNDTAQWYYASPEKQKIGPISWDAMRELAASGALQPSQMVLLDGTARWQSAESVTGLFQTASSEPAQPPGSNTGPLSANGLPTIAPAAELAAVTGDWVPSAGAAATEPAGLATSAFPVLPGYTIIKELGRGGMGVVYEATQTALNRRVALKMVLAGAFAGADGLARFQQEAETVASVEHENIVRIYERGDNNGLPFFSLELIEGGTLEHRIESNPFSIRESAELLEALARAVHHVHERGVIHRDLKPANVLLTPDGRPKISDFGLARLLQNETGQTRTGAVMGTPQYMAPEQAAGDTKQAGREADVYALGAILYRLLSGKPPFHHRALKELLRQVQEDDPLRPRRHNSSIPLDLEIICLKCLRKQPEERYRTAAELAEDLRRFLNHEPILARPLPGVVRLWRWTTRSRARAAIAGMSGLLLLLCIVLGMVWLKAERKRASGIREANAQLRDAKLSFASGQYEAAHALLASARSLLADTSGVSALRENISELLETSETLMNLKNFRESAAEAEFHLLGSLWSLLPDEDTRTSRRHDLPASHGPRLDTGIALAQKALRSVALLDADDPAARCQKPGLNSEESVWLTARAAEMFFLLALAVERQSRAGSPRELEEARKEAARLLDVSGRLDNRPLMLHRERARLHGLLDQPEKAQAGLDAARERRPTSFLDHHLQGAEFAGKKQWPTADSAYQLAQAARPSEYWTLFRLAHAKENLKQFVQAETMYGLCAALRPGETAALNSRGRVLHAQKRWKDAEQVFEECLKRDPDYTAVYGNLILSFAEQRRPEAAEEVMQRYQKRGHHLREEEGWVYNHLGVAYERVRQLPRALEYYEKALERDPKLVAGHRNRAIVLQAQNRFSEAEKAVRTAIGLDEKDGELWYVLGNLYAEWKRPADAVKAMQTATEKAPHLANAWYNLGVLLRRQREFSKALECQKRALELAPRWDLAQEESASCLAGMGEFAQALRIVERLVEDRPQDAERLRLHGSLLSDVGKYEESEAVLNRAIEKDGKHPTGYRNRAVTFMRSKQWRKAIDDFNEYLKRAPDGRALETIFNDLSIALWEELKKTKDQALLKEALAALNQAVERKRTPSNLSNRGNFYLQIGEKQKALADFTETLKLDEKYIRAWALRGQLYLRLGDYAQAARDLRKAVDLNTEHTETPLLLALALAGEGNNEAARGLLETVARKRAEHPRGYFALGMLRYLDGKYPEAVTSLSQAYSDEALRPWTVLLRGRSWARIAGTAAYAHPDAEEHISLQPQDGLAHYHAACIEAAALKEGGMAMKDRMDKVLDRLERALELQPELRSRLKTESDLKPLFTHPRFEQLAQQN